MPSPRRSARRCAASSPELPPRGGAPAVPEATAGRFVAGVGLQSLGRGGQALAAFATVLVLAAALDAPALGVYGVYETLFAFVEALVDGGSGNALLRRAGARPEALRPGLRQAFRFRLASASVGALVVLGYAAFDSQVTVSHSGLLLCVLALYSQLATTRGVVFALQLRFGAPSATRALTALAVFGVVAGMVAAGVRDPLMCLAGAHLTRAGGNLVLGAIAGRRLHAWPRGGPPETGFLGECLALGAGGVVREAYGRIDLLLVRALLGTAAAGLYTPVRKLFHLSLQLPSFIGVVAMPALAAAGDAGALRRRCYQMARRMAWFSLPAAALAWPLTPWVVELLFGPEFADSARPLQILAVAAALIFPGSILTTGMVAQGAARPALRLAVLVLVVAAAANACLIPLWSLAGAATARVLAEAVALGGALRYFGVRRPFLPDPPSGPPTPHGSPDPASGSADADRAPLGSSRKK